MEKKSKFFYGWIIIACLFAIAMFPMAFYSNFFSYYQVPVSEEFGCTYAQFSLSNTASTVASILFSLTLASKLGKGNTRLFMLIGGLVGAVALYAQSCITAIWQLYITFFIVNFALSAITYIPINILISNWFEDKKGLVTSVVFAGSGLGGMLFSGWIANIIANQGWRAGWRITALIVAVTVVIVFIFIRKTPQEMGLAPYKSAKTAADVAAASKAAASAGGWAGLSKSEAFKTTAFWFYVLCLVCCGVVAAGVFTQVPTYLIENGVDYAPVMAVFSGVTIVGTVVTGPLIDKLGISKGSVVTCLISGIAIVCLILVTKFGAGAAYACMIIIPFGAAITSLAPPLLTGSIFGYKDYGGIYGIGNSCFMAGCMIGPMLSSGLRDATGSYFPAWIAMIISYAVLAIGAVLAIKTGNKINRTAA